MVTQSFYYQTISREEKKLDLEKNSTQIKALRTINTQLNDLYLAIYQLSVEKCNVLHSTVVRKGDSFTNFRFHAFLANFEGYKKKLWEKMQKRVLCLALLCLFWPLLTIYTQFSIRNVCLHSFFSKCRLFTYLFD